MKKTVIALFLCLWFQFTCCHDDATGKTKFIDDSRNERILKMEKRLKCITTSHSSISYFYNSLGKLDHSCLKDTRITGSNQITENYFYNSAGKMILSISPLHTNIYSYDLTNRLIQHTRIDSSGIRDSVTFNYSEEGEVIGTWKNIIYYFKNNLLVRAYNGAHETQAGEVKGLMAYYTYNSKRDFACSNLLKSFDPLTLADFNSANPCYFCLSELTFYEQKASNISFIPQKFERIYDEDNYPLKLRILAITGSVAEEISYSYYDSQIEQ